MQYEYDYSRLRGRIVEKFGTLKDFFKKLSITETMAYRKINGKAGFSQKDITEWSGLLDITLIDIGPFFYAIKV